ncbi:UDP-N-acetylmuramoyl-tripeptide--D-alanyl-D-alanine ligase [Bifidobacterium sp. 82T24]|uniref:UDP-N-acetylmuramoyl-tripeptide--D-alanyl-D- alanine ligase n=1 Tax=Bifidobacterium pluvialisilvae TaxID=2834436 RepID=UPI001C597806|nr:UDP-N-acetylmuramoyl-tripeptide--D-alanyl-D-alanine ligase [Bifidobacterium pluvialisilvae]MBW3087772.1 UDP-N-acetylmuramoyl-tripeptide--D-alanyl-D-alanine ligase [Bifidobacterium pluvialisilvae]
MMAMTVQDAAKSVAGLLHDTQGDGGSAGITSVVTDSRKVGPGALFVAIAGEHVDGHDFVGSAAKSGAVAALVDHVVEDAPVAQIVVKDTIAALGLLAKANIALRRAAQAPFTVVGITGSVGKTTTKDLLKALLASQAETIAPIGSFNNDIGMPLTALEVGERTRFLVSEMGASHLGEIAYLTSLVRPDISIVLKVGVAHLGEFGSVENIQKAKSEIVEALDEHGVAILNADDEHVVPMAAIAPGKVFWFGQGSDAQIRAWNVTTDEHDRAEFDMMLPDVSDPCHVRLAIPGRHNVMNALAAASAAWYLGVPADDIVRILGEQRHISPHRMSVFRLERGGADFTVIDDSFNANPDSMKAGLDGLAGWSAVSGGRPFRIAVLGSMLELGGDEAALHRSIGEYAVHAGVDAVIAVGGEHDALLDSLAGDLAEGARAASGDAPTLVETAHNVDEADLAVIRLARDHDHAVVLLKGSHASGLSALASRWERNDHVPDSVNAGAATKNGETL